MKLSKSSVDRVLTAFADLDLGDPRRTRRVMQTVENLASNPRASFPDAMGSEADIEGAYRLMSKPSAGGVVSGHCCRQTAVLAA